MNPPGVNIFARILAGYSLILLVMLATGAMTIAQLARIGEAEKSLASDIPTLLMMGDIRTQLHNEQVAVLQVVLSEKSQPGGQSNALEDYRRAEKTLADQLAELDRFGAERPEMHLALPELRQRARAWESTAAAQISAVQTGQEISLEETRDSRLVDAARQTASTIRGVIAAYVAQDTARSDQVATVARRTVAVMLGVSTLLTLLTGFWVARGIAKPLGGLTRAANRIAAGEVIAVPVLKRRDEVGALSAALARMVDGLQRTATREQNLREALERAMQVKARFLANMWHELRTPLNGIIGFSEMLQRPALGPLQPKQRQYVDNILESGQRLLGVINDILELAEVDAGKLELKPSRLALPDLLRDAVAAIQATADRKGVQVKAEIPESALAAFGDAARLRLVLARLLSNAVKFTPAGGHVSVRATRGPDVVSISVVDTGIGIAPAEQVSIFDEFKQVDDSASRPFEGSGLGLTLCRRLVELHGGTIAVHSQVGSGSTFTFTVPLYAERRAAA